MRLTLLAALLMTMTLAGCGGGGTSSGPPAPPPPTSSITSVVITTNAGLIKTGQSVIFNATVAGTGNFNSAVTWAVNGVTGGDTTNGTIPNGNYTAPAALPPTNPVTITATSVEDHSKNASVTVNIFAISINPATASVAFNHTKQFTAVVTGVSNPVIVWSAQLGSVDATGLYTAPTTPGTNSTDTVTAGLTNATGTASSSVTLQIPTPVLDSITPNGASASESVIINGQDIFGVSKVFFPGPGGILLQPDSSVLSSTQIKTSVPLGAISGQVLVKFNFNGQMTSAAVAFTRLPNLRIRADAKDLSSGESVQFKARLLGASTPSSINWTSDLGIISTAGLYQAPNVSQETFATVKACLANTRSCDATMLRIVPLRIAPALPTVSHGQSLQLDAIQGSSSSASWSVVAGGGTITSTGLFTAPSSLAQAGGVRITAKIGNTTETTSAAVTGAFPGLVARTYDYMNFGYDPNKGQGEYLQQFEGTYVQNLAVSGNRIIDLDVGVRANPALKKTAPIFTALEMYDATNPNNPVWVDAAESIIAKPNLFSAYSHYLIEAEVGLFPGQPYNGLTHIALYDIQTNVPKLLTRIEPKTLSSISENNGVLYGSPNTYSGTTAPFYIFDTTSGAIVQRQVNVPPPAGVSTTDAPVSVIGNGNLMYVLYFLQSGDYGLVSYDISSSSAVMLDTISFHDFLSRANMLIRGNLLFVSNHIFDISSGNAVEAGIAPTQDVQDVQGTWLLGRGFLPAYAPANHYVLVDITDPSHALIKSSVYDAPDGPSAMAGRFVGSNRSIMATNGLGGLAAIDMNSPGGIIDKSRVGGFEGGEVFDHVVNQQSLYVVGAGQLGSGLLDYDLTSGTPVFVGALIYPNAALALQVTNKTAFVGFDDSLKTIDVTDPSNPVEKGSLALPTNALALAGNTLFDGSRDSKLVTLNVTNLSSPSVSASIALPSIAVNMRLIGNTLLVADGPGGLLIFNVSNPAAPILLSQLVLNTPVWDVASSGTQAFLAADSSGLVIVDISNLTQPKQLSQTTLESYNMFPYFLDEAPRSIALAVGVNNGLVYVGTGDSAGLVFGFDYSKPDYPRLVSLNGFAEFVDSQVTGFTFLGNDLFVFGGLGVQTDIVQSDNTSPRNVIELYSIPSSLKNSDFFITRASTDQTRGFVHPKFNRHLLQKQGKKTGGQEVPYRTAPN